MWLANYFLNGNLDEKINIELSPGYKIPMICKLVKTINNLKQASPNGSISSPWHFVIGTWSDHTLFTRFSYIIFVAILIYVDDIFITSFLLWRLNWIVTSKSLTLVIFDTSLDLRFLAPPKVSQFVNKNIF